MNFAIYSPKFRYSSSNSRATCLNVASAKLLQADSSDFLAFLHALLLNPPPMNSRSPIPFTFHVVNFPGRTAYESPNLPYRGFFLDIPVGRIFRYSIATQSSSGDFSSFYSYMMGSLVAPSKSPAFPPVDIGIAFQIRPLLE